MYFRPTMSEWVIREGGLTVRASINLPALEACWKAQGIHSFPALRWAKHPTVTLGNSYDVARRRMSIDIEGCVQYALAQLPGNLKGAKWFLTKSIAHESRHAWQHQRYGRWFMQHDHLTYAAFILLGFAWMLCACIHVMGWAERHAYPGWSFLTLIGTVVLLAQMPRWFRVWHRVLFHRFTYRRNWIERDAERFARKAVLESDWRQVVSIQIIPKPPSSLARRRYSYTLVIVYLHKQPSQYSRQSSEQFNQDMQIRSFCRCVFLSPQALTKIEFWYRVQSSKHMLVSAEGNPIVPHVPQHNQKEIPMAKATQKRKKYSVSQRSAILAVAKKQHLTAGQVEKKFGVKPVTYYSWRKKTGITQPKRRGGHDSAIMQSDSTNLEKSLRIAVRSRLQTTLPGIVRHEVSKYMDELLAGGRKQH